MTTRFDELAESVLDGTPVTPGQGLNPLSIPDPELMDLVRAGSRFRHEHFGMTIKLNYLVTLKSGICPEFCSYCSQALGSAAEILKYSSLTTGEAIDQAKRGIWGTLPESALSPAVAGRASGTSAGSPTSSPISRANTRWSRSAPARESSRTVRPTRSRKAGVDAYNHNGNTAESCHDTIVDTHTYANRTNTVERAKPVGLSPCSGLIVGAEESDEQVIEALFALRELDSESIPISFCVPFDGTPLEGRWDLTPTQCLRIVATAWFVPDREIRLAGGGETT